jgi:hypothetical protein
MRQLLYIPIIHSSVDLGSAGAALTLHGAALAGEGRWAVHQETVNKFWESVAAYLRSLDPRCLRVYQDGLAAAGELGRRVVQEAAKRGSPNYQLVLEMLDGGAELRQTEDPLLLTLERENILAGLAPGATDQEGPAARRYREQRDRLTEERDSFIAGTIGATLREGEVGVLFLGAYHQVASYLAADISVQMVKDPEGVCLYLEELFLGHDDARLRELADYLAPLVCGGGPEGSG